MPNIPKDVPQAAAPEPLQSGDIAKQSPPAPDSAGPTAPSEATSGEPPRPTWLERFGPFLKSQLEEIFTGSIKPPAPAASEPRCEPARKESRRVNSTACHRAHPTREKSARRRAPMSITPSTMR
jgi:hypothetical protein